VRQQSDSTAVADSLPLQELERVSIDVDYHHPLLRLNGPSTGKLFNVSWSLPGARQTKTSMEDLGCHGQSHFRRPPNRDTSTPVSRQGSRSFSGLPTPLSADAQARDKSHLRVYRQHLAVISREPAEWTIEARR
jgi:hypothetical protein